MRLSSDPLVNCILLKNDLRVKLQAAGSCVAGFWLVFEKSYRISLGSISRTAAQLYKSMKTRLTLLKTVCAKKCNSFNNSAAKHVFDLRCTALIIHPFKQWSTHCRKKVNWMSFEAWAEGQYFDVGSSGWESGDDLGLTTRRLVVIFRLCLPVVPVCQFLPVRSWHLTQSGMGSSATWSGLDKGGARWRTHSSHWDSLRDGTALHRWRFDVGEYLFQQHLTIDLLIKLKLEEHIDGLLYQCVWHRSITDWG